MKHWIWSFTKGSPWYWEYWRICASGISFYHSLLTSNKAEKLPTEVAYHWAQEVLLLFAYPEDRNHTSSHQQEKAFLLVLAPLHWVNILAYLTFFRVNIPFFCQSFLFDLPIDELDGLISPLTSSFADYNASLEMPFLLSFAKEYLLFLCKASKVCHKFSEKHISLALW